jgi:hypothetical protein
MIGICSRLYGPIIFGKTEDRPLTSYTAMFA